MSFLFERCRPGSSGHTHTWTDCSTQPLKLSKISPVLPKKISTVKADPGSYRSVMCYTGFGRKCKLCMKEDIQSNWAKWTGLSSRLGNDYDAVMWSHLDQMVFDHWPRWRPFIISAVSVSVSQLRTKSSHSRVKRKRHRRRLINYQCCAAENWSGVFFPVLDAQSWLMPYRPTFHVLHRLT